MIDGRDLEAIVNAVIGYKKWSVSANINYQKWEWGVRLIYSGVTILALLAALKYLANVRW